MTSPLAGRVALVTGASRGIGRATAELLADNGVIVGLVSRNAAALDDVVRYTKGSAVSFVADLLDSKAVTGMAAAFQAQLGIPDFVVNNAGVFELAALEQMSVATFRAAVDTNLVAPFLVLRAFLSGMRARGSGHVVTIGSIADRTVFAGNGAYAAAKHGVRAMHEVLREETRGSGVRATLVSPGPVDTELWDSVLADDRNVSLPTRENMLSPHAVAAGVLFAVQQPAEVNIDELRLSRS